MSSVNVMQRGRTISLYKKRGLQELGGPEPIFCTIHWPRSWTTRQFQLIISRAKTPLALTQEISLGLQMRSKMTNVYTTWWKFQQSMEQIAASNPNGELVLTGTDAAYIETEFHGHYDTVTLGLSYKCDIQAQGYYYPCVGFGLRSRSVFPLPQK